ncbi:MAG: gamma-glutamylcyclotransferase family protein [Burkholderiaceae bacterium]
MSYKLSRYPMKQLVFVFGTLKEGFPNFATNMGKRLPGVFLTRQRYPFYLVGERHSPWLINLPGEGERILGQVFEVDQAALDAMDRLERITEPDGYRRIVVEVESSAAGETKVVAAFAYLKQPQHYVATEVRSGPLSEYTLEHAALYRQRT